MQQGTPGPRPAPENEIAAGQYGGGSTQDSGSARVAGEQAGPAAPGRLEGGGDGAPIDPARETPLWTGRTSWKHYAGRVSLWVLLVIGSGVILWLVAPGKEWLTLWRGTQIVVGVAVLTGLLILGPAAWRIWSCRYRLTTQRLFIERGIINQTIDHTELIRVDDVRIQKTLFDRFMGLGTVIIFSTDASDAKTVIEGVDQPEVVAEHIRTNMRALRKKSLFVENL